MADDTDPPPAKKKCSDISEPESTEEFQRPLAAASPDGHVAEDDDAPSLADMEIEETILSEKSVSRTSMKAPGSTGKADGPPQEAPGTTQPPAEVSQVSINTAETQKVPESSQSQRPTPFSEQARQLQSIEGARLNSQKAVDEVFADCERDEDGGIKIGDIYLPPPPPPACTFDNTGPRLIISQIENSYFKSYGKHVIIGPLHKNYSGIVGPNGSGKSNVIDSMLFVFGYRSKKVRAQKVGNLIHNCDVHPNIQSCTVNVHFEMIVDKGENYDVLPGSQLVIGRTAHKDNSSHYTINGRQVPQKVVTRTLREKGIDLDHDRFLILQGEVEQISMMKPKGENENDDGMLEYLEDIIGTNRYKEPIDKFVKNVDALQEERNGALDRVQLAEQDMQGSKQMRDEALEFLTLSNDIVKCDQKLYEIRKLQEDEKRADVGKRLKEEQDALDKTEESMNKFLDENKQLTEAHKKLAREEAQVAKEVEDLQAQYTELEKKDLQCIEDIKHSKTTIKKLEKDLDTQTKKLEKFKEDTAKLPEQKAAAEESAEHLKLSVQELEEDLHSRMEDLNAKVSPIQEKKEVLDKKLLEAKQGIHSANSALNKAKNELELMTSSERAERKRLEEIEENLSAAHKDLEAKSEQFARVREALPNLKKEYERAMEELKSVDRDYEARRVEFRDQNAKLRLMREAESEKKEFNALTSLMAERNKSLKGLVGRLGDLGGIDNKFDVAISMSCGHLDSVVVDTTKTATNAIRHLQAGRLGRKRFLAMETINHVLERARRPFRGPENAPRLFDLVKISDPVYTAVFYFALRDTLVADNLETANRIGLGGSERFRVVTLKGEIVDPSGTLTGGGGGVTRGKMGTSAKVQEPVVDRAVHRESLSVTVRDLDSEVNALAAKKNDLERTVSMKKRDFEQISQQHQKLQLDLGALKDRIATLQSRLENQEKVVRGKQIDPERLAAQEKKIEEAKVTSEAALKATESDRAAVDELNDQIDAIKEASIGSVKAKLQKAQKDLKAAQAKITECQVGMNNSERKLKQAEQKLADMRAELESVQERRKQNKELYDELSVKAGEINDSREKALVTKSELSARVSESAKNLHEFNRQETKLKSRQIEQKNIVKDLEKEFNQSVKIIESLDRKIKGLVLEFVDDGEDDSEVAQNSDTGLPPLNPEEVKSLSAEAVDAEKAELTERKNQIRPNLNSIQEFKRKMGHYKSLSEVYLGKQRSLDQYKNYLRALKKARLQEFMTGFKIITQKVKEMYRTITLGGDADLELVDSLDPFSEGIAFSVRPPRKTWKNISNLSGGEKTLSSLSLVFALHYYKPAPFYVMDEIDAALDHKNVSIIANYIKERTKNTQFIIISLRDEMFSLARKLTGIFKPYNDTSTLTLDIANFVLTADRENESPGCFNAPNAS